MTPLRLTPLLLVLTLLVAACSPQTSTPSAPTNAARKDPDAPTAAEERAAANAPPPSKLTAAGSRLSAKQNSLNAQAASAAASADGLGSGRSALHAQVTGLTAEETEKGVELNMSSDVLFDFDKATLKPEAAAVLQQAAAIINERGNSAAVTITGHTDSKGAEQYNIDLSLARGQAVKDALAQYGVSAPMQVHGRGESVPVAPNEHPDGSDNPAGRAQNRRVEVLVTSD
ncbi:MAG: OmpA family protein [Pseudomonadota bacterium]|nr:OmpA family protein [Pseudomonadota bacterium]